VVAVAGGEVGFDGGEVGFDGPEVGVDGPEVGFDGAEVGFDGAEVGFDGGFAGEVRVGGGWAVGIDVGGAVGTGGSGGFAGPGGSEAIVGSFKLSRTPTKTVDTRPSRLFSTPMKTITTSARITAYSVTDWPRTPRGFKNEGSLDGGDGGDDVERWPIPTPGCEGSLIWQAAEFHAASGIAICNEFLRYFYYHESTKLLRSFANQSIALCEERWWHSIKMLQ
jgi:hypothetical protein